MGALASIVGIGLVAALSAILPLRLFYAAGGLVVALAGLVVLRVPRTVGASRGAAVPRIVVRRKYWLYYVLTFFEGCRTQVFGAFGTLVLVEYYDLRVGQISLLLAVSGLLNFRMAPYFGRLIDRVGERVMLSSSYLALALCFVGYATVHNAWFLAAMLLGINLLITMRIGLSSYVNRIAPRGTGPDPQCRRQREPPQLGERVVGGRFAAGGRGLRGALLGRRRVDPAVGAVRLVDARRPGRGHAAGGRGQRIAPPRRDAPVIGRP